MAKTWGEIKNQTLNLGFEKIKAYEKNKLSYIEAYNWAQNLISSTIGGVLNKIVIECNPNNRILDLKDICSDFNGLSQLGVRDLNTGEKIDNLAFYDNRFIVLPKGYEGKISISYFSQPKNIDLSVKENDVCLLPDKWANLIPYLMANRLYLDDDMVKAGYYWNLYDDMKNQILLSENTPEVFINNLENGWCF